MYKKKEQSYNLPALAWDAATSAILLILASLLIEPSSSKTPEIKITHHIHKNYTILYIWLTLTNITL